MYEGPVLGHATRPAIDDRWMNGNPSCWVVGPSYPVRNGPQKGGSPMNPSNTPQWRTSSRCEANACVEVAPTTSHILIRNSGNPDGPQLSVPRAHWRAFVADLKLQPADPA
jgi:hypothetical protein